MKKILYIILSIIIILAAVGLVLLQKEVDRMDQIKLQYENEVISQHKRVLEFDVFEEALANQSNMDKDRVRGLVLGKDNGEVQELVKLGQLTVEELVLFYVERIKQYDGYYNSVIQLNPKALEEARAIDKKIKDGQDFGALAGVVVLVKDNVAARPMNTAAGAYALKDLTTERDAFVVETIRDKDGVILGKNNLSEWSNFMSMPSSNGFSVLGGQTKNAYGRFDVGGSSSGPAVAAAMNFASVTIGSETSGSLIYPANQNSVVTLKPTMGTLSRDLVVPITEAQDTLGVMGRSVQDVYDVFKETVAVDQKDPKSQMATQLLEQGFSETLNKSSLQGKRIGLYPGEKELTSQLIKDLEALGATVIKVQLNEEAHTIDMMTVLNYGIVHDLGAFLNNEAVNSPYKSLEEIHHFNSQLAEERMPYGDALHEAALAETYDHEEMKQLIAHNQAVTAEAIDALIETQNLDGLVSFSNDLSGVYAPAGYPALIVPAGYKESGEPYGVTFVGRELEDVKLFNFAYAYEQGTQYRKPTQLLK